MYTVDYSVDVPVMLLNKQIGPSYNEDGTPDYSPYIDGAAFQEEIMNLDSLGKKAIQIWICCEGGSVMDAMKICSAILRCKTPVDTVNTGVCASSAGMVFMCGRNRIMMDYATFMAHPVSGPDDKAKAALTKCIADLASANANFNSEFFASMMSVTTWLDAQKCLDMGICTSIEATAPQNKKYMPKSNRAAIMEYCNKLTEDLLSNIQKTNLMDLKSITNKLNLVDGADLNVINSAIDALITARNQAETTASNLTEQLTQAQSELQAATNKVTELQAAVDAANAEKKAAEDAALETSATEMVNKYTNKIGKDATVIAKFVNMAKADMEGTKTILEAIPLNKVGARATDNTTPEAKSLNVTNIMAEIKNRITKKTA